MLTFKKIFSLAVSCLALCAPLAAQTPALTDARTADVPYVRMPRLGITKAGKKFFNKTSIRPISDIGILTNRQNLLKTLIANQDSIGKMVIVFNALKQLQKETLATGDYESYVPKELACAISLKKILESKTELDAAYAQATSLAPLSATSEDNKEIAAILMQERHQFYAELDAYVSVAQNMINATRPCCFAEFIEASDTATVQATNVWGWTNPHGRVGLAGPGEESITLGTDAEHPQTMVTTIRTRLDFLKAFWQTAFIENIISAQAFGIAHAQSFKLTPFTHFSCVAQAPEIEGKSRFSVETYFMHDLVNQVNTLASNERALIVTDFFTFTEETVREKIAQAIRSKMAANPNVVYIHVLDFGVDACVIPCPAQDLNNNQ